MLNRVILIGRLTRDPELRYTPSGVAVTQFTLAVDRSFSNQQGEKETDFINIVTWRQLAENCANYLRKGRLAAVDGRLQVRNYDNNEGKKVYVTEVIAENVRFLESSGQRGDESGAGGKATGGGQSGGYSGGSDTRPNSGSNSGGSRSNEADPFSNDGKLIDISDDDLPF